MNNIKMKHSLEMIADFNNEKKGSSHMKISNRRIRRINPLGMRVVIKIIPESNKTDTGLFIPETAKDSMGESLLGEVLEVATAQDEDNDTEANISGIPLGAMVLIAKHAGVKVPWDHNLRIVDTKDVLAITNEIDII